MFARPGGALIALLLAMTVAGAQQPAKPDRRMAVTMDDLPLVSGAQDERVRERFVLDLIEAIRRQQLPVIGFVNEGKLWGDGKKNPARVGYLRLWLSAGLDLGNHTYSHLDLHQAPVEDFERDILNGEVVTRGLRPATSKPPYYFRHPFLHTGTSKTTRDRIDAFLKKHEYVVAPVTVDNSDYVFAAAYDRAVLKQDQTQERRIVEAYLKYMDGVFTYYEKQSMAIVGREIPQTLLLHANALNGRALDSLAFMLRGRGYRFIRLSEALEDQAYQTNDTYYGPSGISWLHRWALTQGRDKSIFAGEPVVPAWIEEAAR